VLTRFPISDFGLPANKSTLAGFSNTMLDSNLSPIPYVFESLPRSSPLVSDIFVPGSTNFDSFYVNATCSTHCLSLSQRLSQVKHYFHSIFLGTQGLWIANALPPVLNVIFNRFSIDPPSWPTCSSLFFAISTYPSVEPQSTP
jgi:hypothetical protein